MNSVDLRREPSRVQSGLLYILSLAGIGGEGNPSQELHVNVPRLEDPRALFGYFPGKTPFDYLFLCHVETSPADENPFMQQERVGAITEVVQREFPDSEYVGDLFEVRPDTPTVSMVKAWDVSLEKFTERYAQIFREIIGDKASV